jgi:hypothetical protein
VTTNYKAAPVMASPAAAQRLLCRAMKSAPSATRSQHGNATARVLQQVLDWFGRRRWIQDYTRAELRYWGRR